MAAVLVAVAVVVVALVVAVSPSRSLSSRLLTLRQMPAGWVVYTKAVSPAHDCTYKYMEPHGVTQTGSAKVIYDDAGRFPIVEEKIATYTDAAVAFRAIVNGLSACVGVTSVGAPVVPVEHVAPFTFIPVGDQSAAFTLGFTQTGETVVNQLLIVRRGSFVAALVVDNVSTSTTYAPGDTSLLRRLATRVVAQMG